MKLESVRGNIAESFDIPGLLSGKLDYTIKHGTSTIQWIGPKIDVQLWHAILKFFKDTYDATHSECQVRLYCHAAEKKWVAWAFPQEARSYMSAQEINNTDAQEQRAMFRDEDGWQYLGTVHHHCATSAFQSGTDKDNEKGQDGLHITIGKMNATQYDMHARFYLAGAEFVPDMSAFWDIGNYARTLLPSDTHDRVARHQMTIPAPSDTAYPETWKKNLVEIKPTVVSHPVGFHSGGSEKTGSEKTGNGVKNYGASGDFLPEHKRKERALGELKNDCLGAGVALKDLDAAFDLLDSGEVFALMRVACARNRISIQDLVAEWSWEKDMVKAYGDKQSAELGWEGCG